MLTRKLFVLTGEVSGDMHASGVIRELLALKPDLKIFGVGGPRLRELGADLMYTSDQLSIMGFAEVIRHAGFLRTVIRDLKEAVRRERPDAALLIDYPGMNMLMAAFLHDLHIPVIYYISPQVWAWKEGRVKAIRKYVDRLLVIFDFEVDFYRRHGINAEFVGNPVVEELREVRLPSRQDFFEKNGIAASTRLVGLLPGSRKQEIEKIFPEMVRSAALLGSDSSIGFLLGKAPHIDMEHYQRHLARSGVKVVVCSAYELMQFSDLALVTSGTATLESLCFGVPMIVLYKTGRINYFIGKRLVKLPNISLANIVAKGLGEAEQMVPELLQHQANAEEITRAARRILDDRTVADNMRSGLLEARSRLSSVSPSHKVARILAEYL